MPSPASARPRLLRLGIPALALFLAFPTYSPAQQLANRLVLKDGTYQSVTKYEVKGDRVRYYSAEREEWEELPSSLVDWPATEKFEKDRAATPAIPEAALIDKESTATGGEPSLPQVAPGLHLPELSGMFLLDNFQGQPQLVELQQNQGDIAHSARGNVFRGALNPDSVRQTIELEGEHAAVFAHVSVPSIYIKMDDEPAAPTPPPGQTASAQPSQPSLDAPRAQLPEQPQQPEQPLAPADRFRILRLKAQHGKRVVTEVKRSAPAKAGQEQNSVNTTIDRIGAGWLKLTPTQDLPPGEYAIVEMNTPQTLNLEVWPFSVNPNAGANNNPWTPEVKPAAPEKKLSN